jgi:hypothetical protein
MGRSALRAPLPFAFASLLAAGLIACGNGEGNTPPPNSAIGAAELSRYLPEDSELVMTVDITKVRDELDLPEDADAAPLEDDVLRGRDTPQSRLVALTSRVYPVLRDAFAATLDNAKGASPLDGTLIRAAAQDAGRVSVVLTAETFPEIEEKLERFGYERRGELYLAGPRTKGWAPPVVADGGGGRVVFAYDKAPARHALERIEEDAEPGPAAEAIQAVNGSVRMASTFHAKGSRCVEAVAASQGAMGRGAIMALQIEGHKPEPERFDAKRLKTLDTGTLSVLVDALLVPFNVEKPGKKASREPVSAVFTLRGESEVSEPGRGIRGAPVKDLPTPADAYDCP